MKKLLTFLIGFVILSACQSETIKYLTYLADSMGNIVDARKVEVRDSTGLNYQALQDTAARYMVHGYNIYIQSYNNAYVFCRAEPYDPGNFAVFSGTAEPRILFNFRDDGMCGCGFFEKTLFGDSITPHPVDDTVNTYCGPLPVEPYALGNLSSDGSFLRKSIYCDSEVVAVKNNNLCMLLYKFGDPTYYSENDTMKVRYTTWFLLLFSARIPDVSNEMQREKNFSTSAISAFPNPFTASTRIRCALSKTPAGTVKFEIFDTNGRLVRTGAGNAEFTWNGRDMRDAPMPSGIYLMRVTAGGKTARMRLLLSR